MKKMKKIIWLVLYFLPAMTLQIHASSPLLLQQKTYGGYVPMEYAGHENGVQIDRHGVIESFKRKNSLSPLQKVQLGRLSPVALRALMSRIEKINQGELQSETPNQPICMDLPTTDYTLWKKDGPSFVFAQSANCHQYFIEGGEVRNLKNLIDALHVLAPPQE